MKTLVLRTVAAMLLTSLSINANAASMIGTWLDDNAWTLIHAGSGPADSGLGVNNLLRWDPNQQILFDLTGTTLTAGGDQVFTLASNKNDTATFTLHNMELDLSGPNGFNSGFLQYSMVVNDGGLQGTITMGTFMFDTASFAGTPFNSSTNDSGEFNLFIWGGDVGNDIGIDIGITSAVVPLPAPLLLFASGLFGLGAMRRRRS